MGFFGIVIFVIIAGGLLILLSHFLDRNRIKNYIASKGGNMESLKWTPFGKGWAGDESNSIHKVIYRDKEGKRHQATVKTGLFSAVYFTDDELID